MAALTPAPPKICRDTVSRLLEELRARDVVQAPQQLPLDAVERALQPLQLIRGVLPRQIPETPCQVLCQRVTRHTRPGELDLRQVPECTNNDHPPHSSKPGGSIDTQQQCRSLDEQCHKASSCVTWGV